MSSKFISIEFPPAEQAKFQRWVKTMKEENKRQCQYLIYKTSQDIVRRAKMFAPVNFGFLRSSIGRNLTANKLGAEIAAGGMGKGVNVKYAPYPEFGTGTKVVVPSDLKDYAIQFKGKGIRKVNQRAQPYFFPAVRISINEMTARLRQMGFKDEGSK